MKLKKLTKILAIFLSILALTSPASAIQDSILDKLDANNIYYYDPTASTCTGTTSPVYTLSTTGDNLTLIGDSLLHASLPALQSTFPDLSSDHIYTSADYSLKDTVFAIEELDPDSFTDIIILSLASPSPDDTPLTASFLNQLLNHLGTDKYLFLVTAQADPLARSDLDFTAHNRLLRSTALARKQTFIVDWQTAISGQESTYLEADGFTPNAAGQSLLATTIYNTISADRTNLIQDVTDTATSLTTTVATVTANLPTSTLNYLENSNIKDRVEANLSIYTTVAAEKDLPWQLLAAIHFREANLDPNKSMLNGQPILSYSYTNVDGQSTATSLIEDARLAADHLIAMGESVYDVHLTSASSVPDIANAVLAYGRGYMYKTAGATYDQYTYVMNGFDEQHLMTMRWIHADSYSGSRKLNSLEGTEDRRPGVLALMTYLGSEITLTSSITTPVCAVEYTASVAAGGDILDEGGMTLEQARIFMMRYGENKNNDSHNTVGSHWNFCNGGGSNCATFSHFFVNKFSTTTWGGGNGNMVVSNLAKNGARTGTEPAVYSVFSTNPNHTAVVLGHHGKEWYIGHASCSSPNIGKGDGTKEGGGSGYVFVEISDDPTTWKWTGSWVKFAYLDGVDTNKLEDYINNGP